MKVHIPQEVYDKIWWWINNTDKEISGFGRVQYNKETDTFEVLDAYMLKQEGGYVHTEIDEQAHIALIRKTRTEPGWLHWWWHSHVNMDVFWSSQDKETIKELGKHGWMLATVFNKKGEHRSAIGFKTSSDFGDTFNFTDDLDCHIYTDPTPAQVEAWKKEFDENFREQRIATVTSLSDYNGSEGITVWDEKQNRLVTHKNYDDYKKWREDQGWGVIDSDDMPYDLPHRGLVHDATARDIVSEQDAERQEILDWGRVGFGAEAEAKFLGMKTDKYIKKCLEGDRRWLDTVDNQLDAAVRKGKLR